MNFTHAFWGAKPCNFLALHVVKIDAIYFVHHFADVVFGLKLIDDLSLVKLDAARFCCASS